MAGGALPFVTFVIDSLRGGTSVVDGSCPIFYVTNFVSTILTLWL